MNFPEELKYTKWHEWILIENEVATVGITYFAQDSLGDIVYLELPEIGAEVEKDKTFGVVESVKAVSDIFAPLSGKVKEVNTLLLNQVEIINEDPYGDAWMVKIEMKDPSEVNGLLSANEYRELVKKEG